MKRVLAGLLVAALAAPTLVLAQDVMIRNATVHTAGSKGTVRGADVLVQGGIIRAVGPGLLQPANIAVIDAGGKPLTPGLFGGLSGIGIEEVSAEKSTVDSTVTLPGEAAPQMRPEFDVTVAYNPASMLLPVARLGGVTFTALSANSSEGGSLVAGQGGVVRLDGDPSAEITGARLLYINLGGSAGDYSGGSRAAHFMLLEQAIREARGLTPYGSPYALLTPTGRETLARYLSGGRVVFNVDRAADIRQVLAFSKRHGLRPMIIGGAEAWQVARELKAANVTVFIDALQGLPSSFDQLGSRLDNAALLAKAGTRVALLAPDSTHNARKIRQAAGNATANGLPWELALASITRVPAEALGVGDRLGRIEVGLVADLVLWDGDPLEVSSLAERVWMGGKSMPMRSRQTELRDRYLPTPGALPRAYSH